MAYTLTEHRSAQRLSTEETTCTRSYTDGCATYGYMIDHIDKLSMLPDHMFIYIYRAQDNA
jgi:hypothetical protein